MNLEDENRVGSLERMGIATETLIDSNILTPGGAKAVRFRVSKPSGYAFSEVDSYMQTIVTPSIEWLVNTLHQRDKAVYTLGAELDKAETDIKNLKGQIQFLEYNSQIKKGIDKSGDDKEVAALLQRLETTEAEAANLRQQLANGGQTIGIDPETEAYVQQITEQYNGLVKQYEEDTTALQDQLNEALLAAQHSETFQDKEETVSPETQAYIDQITEQYNGLVKQYEDDTTALQDQLNTALAAQAVAEAALSDKPDVSSETEAYIAQITEQYNALVKQYEDDTNELKAQVSGLESDITQLRNQPADEPGLDAETEAYIAQITEQYNALVKQYEDDTTSLQTEMSNLEQQIETLRSTPVSSAEDAERISELEEYAAQVAAQYTELVTRYEEDIVNVTGPTAREIELEQQNQKLFEKIAQLEEELTQREPLKAKAEAKVNNGYTGLSLPTDEKARTIDGSKYGELPPGIRPDDLE